MQRWSASEWVLLVLWQAAWRLSFDAFFSKVKLLLEQGANPALKNSAGKTAQEACQGTESIA